MIPYLFVFAVSLFCINVAQRQKKNSVLFWGWALMAIFVPTLLAGLRDNTIGTDVLTYVDDIWEDVRTVSSLSELNKNISDNYYEVGDRGYIILNYLLRMISDSPHLAYFGVSSFMFFFVLLAAKDNRYKASMFMMMFLFLFIYYNPSLNMMRQMMAMSVGLYSYKYLERKQWIKLGLCMTFMSLFHTSSFVYLLVIALFLVFRIKNLRLRLAAIGACIISMFTIFRYYEVVLVGIVNAGLVPTHYLMYKPEEGVFQTSVLIIYFVYEVVFLFVAFLVKQQDVKAEVYYYATFHLFGTALSTLSIVMYDANRLSQYIMLISIVIFLPRTLMLARRLKPCIYPSLLLLTMSISVVGWYYLNIYMGYNETYPYKSAILDI